MKDVDIVARLVYTVLMNSHREASQDDVGREPAAAGHVLLVNYFSPPMAGGGVPRPVKMAKYLRHLGWDVTLLTVEGAGPVDPRLSVDCVARVLRAREWRFGWLLKAVGGSVRLLRLASERLTRRRETGPTSLERGFAYEEREIESSKIGWMIPALRAALPALRASPVDVAIVSLPPAASGTVGWLLNRLRGIPYVVEYRDPWTVGAFWTSNADGRPRTDVATWARYRLTRGLEATLLRASAGAVIVNGEAHVGRLAAAFPRQMAGKPIVHIRNGVDLEDTAAEPASDAAAPLRLLHTGFFYHFYTPHQLISALHLVRSREPEVLKDIELEFMGSGFPKDLAQALDTWGLGHLLRLTEAGNYSDALVAMRRADGLMAVLPALDSDRDRLPTKVYEYLGTDRPILIVADPIGAVAGLVAGLPDVLIADNRSLESVAEAFAAFVQLTRRRRADGYPAENGRRGDPHHYLRRAEEMNGFLQQILAAAKVPVGSGAHGAVSPRGGPAGTAYRRIRDNAG